MARAGMAPLPTHPRETSSLPDQRRHRRERRMGLGLLGVVLLAGALNLLGVRESTVSASGGGVELTVTYAAVSRPGLATPWTLRVHRDGGFQGPVTVATTADYFDLFDENGLDPDPDTATATPDRLVWEFAPPEGEDLVVDFDARLEPAFHTGRDAETSVIVDGEPVATVRYRTVVMP